MKNEQAEQHRQNHVLEARGEADVMVRKKRGGHVREYISEMLRESTTILSRYLIGLKPMDCL